MAKITNTIQRKLALLRKQARVEKNGSVRVYDFKKYLNTSSSKPKRVLVSYLVNPVLDDLSQKPTEMFSNNGAGRTIPKVLNQLGYIVDVINWDDTKPIKREYDLIVSHGGKNFDQIEKLKTKQNKLVYYSTGSYWRYHNDEEQKRLNYFEKRHNTKYKLDREIQHAEEQANAKADAIIALGNQDTANTYTKFKHVFHLQGASMPIVPPRTINELNSNELGFLFMAGPGNLHKGLDIVLDAWEKLPKELHLHIVTLIDDDFAQYYKKQLYDTPNIHTYGFVIQRSKQYYDIISTCQFSMLLSCSEGSPGSVIESMHQGLIPIDSRESHVDIGKYGYVLKQNTVEELVGLLQTLSQLKKNEIVQSQLNLRSWAEKEFTVQRYEQEFTTIIQEVTK